MPLNDEQAFKVGFLLKCAEKGMTLKETHEQVKLALTQLEKSAQQPWYMAPVTGATNLVSNVAGAGIRAIPSTLSLATTLAFLAPLGVGAFGGYGLAKLTGPSKGTAVDEAKKDEIVGEYERLAEEARRRARIKALQKLTGKRIIALSPSNLR